MYKTEVCETEPVAQVVQVAQVVRTAELNDPSTTENRTIIPPNAAFSENNSHVNTSNGTVQGHSNAKSQEEDDDEVLLQGLHNL